MTCWRITLAAAAAAALTGSLLVTGPASARDRSAKPAASGAQASADFTHTPAAEQAVRTPIPVYLEYTGSERVSRVIVKYKGAQMDDWRRLDLKHLGSGWGGFIPCGDVTLGPMRYWV